MSRVQLALRVGDLEGSIDFYTKLFGTEPAKLRPGYANFAIAEPPLKLVLLEGEPGQATVMDHLGVEVETSEQVNDATQRLTGEGMEALPEDNTTCCYALQDKVWVHGPGKEPWEVYTVKGDSPTYGADGGAGGAATASTCCQPDATTGEVDKAAQPEDCCA
ncbi:ArsI/CadI family heavy metal resistance metalloenzyme [Labedaea rhizosphaerae]|uniref:Glyoxalase/bleomycin resistance protein/dioxygenase superfamily protein n=1 Tax=Labedaea rhizosphaerae TaxID=598644 RepID=A0A4R6SHK5_LABRH|nr:ArsI/CadI family heavy metal resistance metalloenzyme [Labedaea rhizosphaerae]TDQ00418.1 glyoxalase/bleomycin resistance protein/dioxygenase superfamily protein [Labedaea rhizosphaerae]